ncbi:MAG: carrier protein [Labilithrix sp.]|nr:carrier protein [Labilithrix sp.]
MTNRGNNIGKLLGVEAPERRSVGLMLAHSFAMGCATVFFETAASAMFLARFPSSLLPWVYIAAAGANTITGSVYARVQQRTSFARLMKGTLGFLIVLVTTVRLGTALSGAAWAAFAGLVAYRVVSSLTDLEYWAVAARIYDVRQAKRLFGLVGTGEVVARIVGSFSVPLLVRLGGLGNLMVLSAVALALCLFLVTAVLRGAQAAEGPGSAVNAPTAAPVRGLGERLREIRSSRYVSIVVLVAVLATFGKYFVEFAYLEQVSTLSKGEEQLAGFLGLFGGITQTLSLLTRLFVSRPLLSRFGIRVGVLVLPVLHAICAAAVIGSGLFGAAPAVVFAFVIANQGIYKTFKHPIDNASFKVLYQPLAPRQRLAAQIAVEILFSPVVVGVAGGVMLLFSAAVRYDPVHFAFVLLLNFVIWALAARSAGRRYGPALVEVIRRRIEGNVVLPFDDATTLAVLRARLESSRPAEVCAALDLLEKAGAPDFTATLLTAVEHPSPDVRRYATERLLATDPAALAGVLPRLSSDPAPGVRGVALKAVAAAGGDDAITELERHLDDADHLVRRVAVAGLVGLGTADAEQRAHRAIAAFAARKEPGERVLAAQLAGEYQIDGIVRGLLADPSPEVRRAALLAAGHARTTGTVPLLVQHLRDPRFAQSAARALAAHGPAVLPALEALFDEDDQVLARRLVYVYRLVGPAAIPALLTHLGSPDVVVRGRVLRALEALGWRARGAERAELQRLLVSEARDAASWLAAARDLGEERRFEALAHALRQEVSAAQTRAFSLLALVHDRIAVQRAAHHLARPGKERRAYALEVLDLMLDGDDRRAVMPLLDQGNAEREALLMGRFPEPRMPPLERLRDLLARPERALRAWTRALAVRAALAGGEPALSESTARAMATSGLVRTLCTPDPKASSDMLPIEKVILLKTVPMFTTTSEDLLAEIAEAVEEVDVPAGTTVFEKGDAGESMYIVVSGRVRVFDGERTLRVLGEREMFGELALLDPAPRSASVAAVEAAHLFRLDGDVFAQLMAGNLDIVRGVLHVLCERLRNTSAGAGGS